MLLRVSVLVLVVYGGLLYTTYWGFMESPAGFIPMQDKGYLLVNVQLPDAASVERTQAGDAAHRDDCGQDGGGEAHGSDCGGSRSCWGANAPQFRRLVRDAR